MVGAAFPQKGHSKSENSMTVTAALAGPFDDESNGSCVAKAEQHQAANAAYFKAKRNWRIKTLIPKGLSCNIVLLHEVR
jgi:surface antigen